MRLGPGALRWLVRPVGPAGRVWTRPAWSRAGPPPGPSTSCAGPACPPPWSAPAATWPRSGHPEGDPRRSWRVGVTHPWQPDGLAGVVEVRRQRRGVHLRDLRTGRPPLRPHHRRSRPAHGVGHRDRALDLPLADALATAVAVGADEALAAVDDLDGYEGWLIRPDGSDAVTGGWRFASARPAALQH